MLTGECLPTPDGGVHVEGVNLDSEADASSPFRGNDRGPTAQEGIWNNAVPGRAVKDCIGDQGHGLDRWVQLAQVPRLGFP